jgi:hypothetical protein
VINSVNNLIYQAISSLESGLLSTPPERLGFSHAANGSTIPDTDEDGNVEYPEARLEIENGLHQLETLLESTVDKAFDKFEIYVLRNIFTVPEDLLAWVRLRHYQVAPGLRRPCLFPADLFRTFSCHHRLTRQPPSRSWPSANNFAKRGS